jgi:hypothetical protein
LTEFQLKAERTCRQFASIKAPKYAVLVGVDVQPNQGIAKAVHEDCEDLEKVLGDCGFILVSIGTLGEMVMYWAQKCQIMAAE